MANVLVVFWSRFGETERLALAAALGAVQGRCNIRLRWLREDTCDPTVPGWQETRERMEKEYIAPRPVDLEWAHGLVLATPPRVDANAAEWRAFFGLRGLEGKTGGGIGSLSDAMAQCQMTIVEASAQEGSEADRARNLGRRVADACTAR